MKKKLSGNVDGEITVSGYYLMNFCSYSVTEELNAPVSVGDSGYFILKKGPNSYFQLPTPTSGFDRITKGKVVATYRHSYHLAYATIPEYELTYQEIWKKLHNQSFNKVIIDSYIREQISQSPAGFAENEIDIFFKQHIALESAYMLGIPISLDSIKKFDLKENFHATVSMLRVLGNNTDEASKAFLLEFIKRKKVDPFCTIIAIESLIHINDPIYIEKLKKLANKLSKEEGTFGGSIMDPRCCTTLSNPKAIVEKLKNASKTK